MRAVGPTHATGRTRRMTEQLILIALAALAVLLPVLWPRWRLRRVLARPLPPAALEIQRRNVPVLGRMAA